MNQLSCGLAIPCLPKFTRQLQVSLQSRQHGRHGFRMVRSLLVSGMMMTSTRKTLLAFSGLGLRQRHGWTCKMLERLTNRFRKLLPILVIVLEPSKKVEL